jgi:hypothetical protein
MELVDQLLVILALEIASRRLVLAPQLTFWGTES